MRVHFPNRFDLSQRREYPLMADPSGQLPFVQPVDDGIQLKLKVVPGASRSQIVGIHGDRLKVKVAAPPEQGKANRAVIELLSQWLGTKTIEIIAGHGHAEKTAKVTGISRLNADHIAALK